jgi:hypothetical protein
MAEKPSKKLAAAVANKKETSGSSSAPAAQQAFGKSSGSAMTATASAKAKVDPAERRRLVAEAAYYLAQKRGFTPGHEMQDWTAAEKQVDAILAKR